MTQDTPLLRLGTRGSPLALYQANETKRRLRAAHPDLADEGAVEIEIIKTTGDKVQDRPLAEIGGKGLFTKEIEEALFDGRIDAAVHSMKDVPTWLPEGLQIVSLLPREDVRDAFFSPVAASLEALPAGALVGSASLRRQAQILLRRPDLKVTNIRGNVQTRLAKLQRGEVQATLLALAGLKRLGREEDATAVLEPEAMLPAVGQGAIGIEIREEDDRTRAWLEAINDVPTYRRVMAERACLDVLEGSCRTPIACLAEIEGDELHLRALIAEPDGSRHWREERRAPIEQAEAMAREVGAVLRAAAGEAFFERLKDTFT